MSLKKSAAALSSLVLLSACYVRVNRSDADDYPYPPTDTQTSVIITPVDIDSRARACEAYDDNVPTAGGNADGCYVDNKDDYKWRVSCKTANCQGVPVYVHYMLTEDLGDNNVVFIEAFDNPHFNGSPVSTVRMGSFQASKPGQYQKADLYLAPGEYYVRAYISNDEQTVIPYPYQNMQMVSNKPTGVYGALSSVQSLTVQPRSLQKWPDPLNIYLDELFKSPQNEQPTNANLRLKFTVDHIENVPDGRNVVIELHQDTDLAKLPLATFKMASETLLVDGRKGKAEFVATNLPKGNYIVFAYLDSNSNGFYDDDELSQIYMKDGQATKVAVVQNRTETIDMKLMSPNSPAPSETPAP